MAERSQEELYNETRQPEFIAVISVLSCICLLVLGLRFYSRKVSGAGWKLDDHLAVVALLSILGENITCGLQLRHGLGRHAIAVPPEELPKLPRMITISQPFYAFGLAFVKFSALFYLRRLFPTPRFKIVVWIMFAYTLAWLIAFFLLFIFKCVPVEKFWIPDLPGTCVNISWMYWINGFTNLLSDVVILAMPLPMIWRLHTSLSHKLLLSGVFALGGLAIAISIVRLVLIFRVDPFSQDPTWDIFEVNFWSPVEASVCFICSCCPTLGPLVTRVYHVSSKLSGYARSKGSRSTDSGGTHKLKNLSDKNNSTAALAKIYREDRIDVESCDARAV